MNLVINATSWWIVFTRIIIGLFFLQACTKIDPPVFDNPIDPLNPILKKPEAIIMAPLNNQEIDKTYVTFSWKGALNESLFSYQLVGRDEKYSLWNKSTSIEYDFFDEGVYEFRVREKYNSIEQEIPTSIFFTVNAVKQCALIINKMQNNVSGSTFYVDLNIEETSRLMGLTTHLTFNKNYLELKDISKIDGQLYSNTDSELFFTNTIPEVNATGVVKIDLVLLGGSKNGFSGNSPVCRLTFNVITKSNSEINFINSKTALRNVNNEPISISMLRKGLINPY